MKDAPQNSSSDLLQTEGGKTKSNAIEVPSVSLPKGGGALRGIDEKFSVNAVNGTAAFSVPLPFAPARGATPSLSLAYNSGSGNSPFGLGWNLSLGSIRRKSDNGLPQYLDAVDSDTYLFSEAEDLVALFAKNSNGHFQRNAAGEYLLQEHNSPNGLFTIRHYLPRTEGLFARIERWTNKQTGRIKWRVTTRENVTTLFGWTDNAVISNPQNKSQIYEWLPEFVFDDKGNCSQYVYRREDEMGIDELLLHNQNRIKDGKVTYTNRYLQKVLYGNQTPYKNFEDAFPEESDYLFQTVFDWGTLSSADSPDTINEWDCRQDAFSTYKSGFEIRTTRLCKRVLLFHVFKELALKSDTSDAKTLVKSVNFEYDTNTEADFTFLKKVYSYGYIKAPDGSYSAKHLPPMEFDYAPHQWSKEVKTIASEDLIHAPAGLEEPQYVFTDLYNEGLAGILSEQAQGWYYKHNLGKGTFTPAKQVAPKPSFLGLGTALQLADLDADGGKQLVSYGTEMPGYFELDDEDQWQPFKAFKTVLNIDLGDRYTRMLDLNGDGKPEVVVSEEGALSWYPSEGRDGFSAARKSTGIPNEEVAGTAPVFADAEHTLFLADMSGDGLTDIVKIRNGEVCYWPNLGWGKFGAKVAMDGAPVFDAPDAFNPAYLRLADIDGSGTTDIIYLGKAAFSCWKNKSGNSFATVPFEITDFPEIHSGAKITVTDLLGNGVACIVWSSPLPKDAQAPLKYIDLMGSQKPHLMTSYQNNLGKEVSFEYRPSTHFYLEDKLADRPWATKLHFPVHCISKTITEDKIAGSRFETRYAYHHGYYDHAERAFRGFGMVEQRDAETFDNWRKTGATNITEAPLHQEPVVSKTWFHTGAFRQGEKILLRFSEEYWYAEMERQGFVATHPETPLPDAALVGAPGIDAAVLDHLSAQERQEAARACKGMALRSETFAEDAEKRGNTAAARIRELTPFSVATHNCVIELLQPKGQNKHAVFAVRESEALTYSYERNSADPRIAHTLNTQFDEWGNVLESASVVYPRLVADASLPEATQQAQRKTLITYTENRFTNDIITEAAYRLRLPSESRTFELRMEPKVRYHVSDFSAILTDVQSDSAPYHERERPLSAGKPQRRLIEHSRTTYYGNSLAGPLRLHRLESLALPFESYQLAYTPALLQNIFAGKVAGSLMAEGKFTPSEGDHNWWIRSGSTQFKTGAETAADAQNRFYVPVSYTDPYGGITSVKYYGDYYLFVQETEDALGNRTGVETFNFRTGTPRKMRDANGNFSEALLDELGLVKAVAVMGKSTEADTLTGLSEITPAAETAAVASFFAAPDSVALTRIGKDLLAGASSRFVYDFEAYRNSGQPVVVAAITREQHFQQLPDSPVQLAFEYSNGMGQVALKKVQAEPGVAKEVVAGANNTIAITEVDTRTLVPRQLRWIGNGRTVLNNKGNGVKQYEPYFSVTHRYEDAKELVETGVTPVLYYDAPGRLVRTDLPNGTFTKVEFDSWKQLSYDTNDTVLDSLWYLRRTDPAHPGFIADPKEQQAAAGAAKHSNTPNAVHFDTLGRPVLSVAHNRNPATGADVLERTKVELDIEGNLHKVTDARENAENGNRGNLVVQYRYDMLGNKVFQESADAGKRWLLLNILGNPLRTWDERNHEFQYFYDAAHRPTHTQVLGGDGATPLNHTFGRLFYGESLLSAGRANEADVQAQNILGQVIKTYDTGGLIDTPAYNFKGQPVSTTRRLFKKYKEVPNWTDADLDTDLEEEAFTFKTDTDALGRITAQTAPDLSVIVPAYNRTGVLKGETVLHPGAAAAIPYIKDIDYTEKGQRARVILGNGVVTRLSYNRETFRLERLQSTRQNGDPLQDWHYTYDPGGNITHIEDKNIPVTFFGNQKTAGLSQYTYDALYRLVEAKGRENNAALSFGSSDNWNDGDFKHLLNAGDPMAVRNYTQSYQYDKVGNLLEMAHVASGNNWTRTYDYAPDSNRLAATHVGRQTYTYPHHPEHGFITALPHLEEMGWNFKEELVKTIRQKRSSGGTPQTTYYQYDGSGQRIRKVTENEAAGTATPTQKEERIYIAGYELYKKHSGTHAGLERESLSLMDAGHRFVMVETRNDVDDGTEAQLVRYQLHNHLGSSALELDATAGVISYEEYHPFGTTAYQATNAAIRSAGKRYRFTGMERDEETGLEYHSARYYLPWLGRWLNADPIGIGDGVNVYAYCKGNPVGSQDTTGTQANEQPSTSFGFTLDSGGNTSVGPFLNLPSDMGGSPSTDMNQTCYGMHPTLGYMPLGIGAECQSLPTYTLELGGGGGSGSTGGTSNSGVIPQASTPEPATVEDDSIGPPGFWGSLIPIYGSGRESINHFQHGNYGRGVLWAGMAVADVFLVKAIVMGAGRLVLRTGATMLTRSTETVAAKATVTTLERAPSLSIETADKLLAESSGAIWSSSGFGSGAEVAELGGWWVKRTGQGNALVRNYGAMGIEAQEQALARLGNLGTEFFMREGMLFTRSAKEPATLLSSAFANGWGRGSYRLGTILNDIRPRNMGAGGLIFDPALPPALHSLWWIAVYGMPRSGAAAIFHSPTNE